jgi:hypothetical protein
LPFSSHFWHIFFKRFFPRYDFKLSVFKLEVKKMKTNYLIFAFFKPSIRMMLPMWLLILVFACGQGPDRRDGTTTGTVWETETADTVPVSEYVLENRQDVIIEYETHFSQVEERIEMIRHRADTIHGDARLHHDETLGSLEQQRMDAHERLNELRQSTQDTWNQLEQEVERSITQLELAIEQAEMELL